MSSWRELRTLRPRQSEFLDALMCIGKWRGIFKPTIGSDGEIGPITPMVLFGGSGYSGKTHALITAAVELNGYLASLGFDGCWGVIICKTYKDLMDRIVSQIEKDPVMMSLGRVRYTQKRGAHFEFDDPRLGGIYFRNVGSDPSKRRGIEYDWMLVDELTQLMRDEIDHLRYTLRSSRGLPFIAFGAATNPDGPGHGWVKRWWIDRNFTYESELVKSGAIIPENFAFIPGRPQDNPTFTPAVEAMLRGFEDPMIVKARWEGSWDLASGTRFPQFSREKHTITEQQLLEHYGVSSLKQLFLESGIFEVFGSMDYGTEAPSVYLLHAIDNRNNIITFYEKSISGVFLDGQCRMMAPIIKEWGVKRMYCDPALSGRDSDGISRFDKFRKNGIPMVLGNNERIEGWATIDHLLYHAPAFELEPEVKPKWKCLSTCTYLIRFFLEAPRNESDLEDVDTHYSNDHAGDGFRYFAHTHVKGPRKKVEEYNGQGNSQFIKDRLAPRRRGKLGNYAKR